jgi:hypothetical protein
MFVNEIITHKDKDFCITNGKELIGIMGKMVLCIKTMEKKD